MIGLTLLGRLQIVKSLITLQVLCKAASIGPLHDSVTWYGINYAGTQVTQWDFQSKETRTSPARLAFVLEVPLCNLRPSIIYSVPCHRIVQRTYCGHRFDQREQRFDLPFSLERQR